MAASQYGKAVLRPTETQEHRCLHHLLVSTISPGCYACLSLTVRVVLGAEQERRYQPINDCLLLRELRHFLGHRLGTDDAGSLRPDLELPHSPLRVHHQLVAVRRTIESFVLGGQGERTDLEPWMLKSIAIRSDFRWEEWFVAASSTPQWYMYSGPTKSDGDNERRWKVGPSYRHK